MFFDKLDRPGATIPSAMLETTQTMSGWAELHHGLMAEATPTEVAQKTLMRIAIDSLNTATEALKMVEESR